MTEKKSQSFDTRTVHAGFDRDAATGAVTPPVYLTSTYAQQAPGVHQGYEYARSRNPTRDVLEQAVAELEQGRFGFAFASGCAAATTLVHLLQSGDHVVCFDDVYGGTNRLFSQVFAKQGIETSFVDLRDPDRFDEVCRDGTRMLWIETPTNPMLKLADIEELAGRAHQHGVLVVVDNTFMTPYSQTPLELGADLVLHSSTKYLNGHSDVVGGVVVCSDAELAERVGFLQNAIGAVPGPLDCFLVHRGLKTLALRMRQHSESAAVVARHLEEHPRVKTVIYPGLASHPQADLARRQMRVQGGMVTCLLDGTLEHARRFLSALQLFILAESLGCVESLVEHPASMTHASVPPEQRAELGISDSLVRLSVGLEGAEDLLVDLDQALDHAFAGG